MMHAEIISIGDELTSGKLLDTNSQWLALELESKGIETLCHTTIADELPAMTAAFAQAALRSDFVIITGGLGPTDDDLTRQAMADAFNRTLEFRSEMFDWVVKLFARRNRSMPEKNRVQAYFPAGSEVIDNPTGTAPGIMLDSPRPGQSASRLYALPGVPSEMKIMYAQSVEPDILKRAGRGQVIVHRKINTFGAGESQVEQALGNLIQRGRVPRVGITASQADISLRIMAKGKSEDECQKQIQPTVDFICQTLNGLVFGEESDSIFDVAVQKLGRQKKTLAVVECGTGGLLAAQLHHAQDKLQTADSALVSHDLTHEPFLGGLTIDSFFAAQRLFSDRLTSGLQSRSIHDTIADYQDKTQRALADCDIAEFETLQMHKTVDYALWTRDLMRADAVLSVSRFPADNLPRAGNAFLVLATCGGQINLRPIPEDVPFGGDMVKKPDPEQKINLRVQKWPHGATPELLPMLTCKRAVNMLLRTDF